MLNRKTIVQCDTWQAIIDMRDNMHQEHQKSCINYGAYMTMQKHHIEDVQESDKLSDEEKQKLTNIKEGLNIIELKENIENTLNNVLQYVHKP